MKNRWTNLFRWLVLASLMLGLAQPGLAAPPATSDVQALGPVITLLPDRLASQHPAAPGKPVVTSPPPPQKPYAPSFTNTYYTPEECGIPATSPAVEDVEPIITGPSNAISKVNLPYAWRMNLSNSVYISDTKKTVKSQVGDLPVSGAILGANRAVAVWKQPSSGSEGYENQLMVAFWNEETGFTSTNLGGKTFNPNLGGALPDATTPTGTPAVAATSREGNEFYVFTRSTGGSIYYKIYTEENGFGKTWSEQAVPSPVLGSDNLTHTYNMVSDPAVVVSDPTRLLVFFLAKNDADNKNKLFMNQGAGTNDSGYWLTRPISLGLPANTTLTDHSLVAVAANEARQAVFVQAQEADNTYSIYAKIWAIDQNSADWSDTIFVKVASGVKKDAPFTASSRWMEHLALVYEKDSDSTLYIKEWGPDTAGNPVWSAEQSLNKTPSAIPSSLSLVTPYRDEMMLVMSVKDSGNAYNSLYYNKQRRGTWQGWSSFATNTVKGSALALTQTSHSALVFGQYYNDTNTLDRNKPYFYHFTDQGATAGTTPAANLSANANPDGQRIVTVDGVSYWLNVYAASGTWKVEVRDLVYWKGQSISLNHGDPVRQDAYRLSVASADMDLDGRDEPVIATMSADQTRVDISWLVLTPTNNPDTVMTIQANKLTSLTGSFGKGVSVMVGDFEDGAWASSLTRNTIPDGRSGEVFVSTLLSGNKSFQVNYYVFGPKWGPGVSYGAGSLTATQLNASRQYNATLYPQYKTTAVDSLGSVAGRFDPGLKVEKPVFLLGREGSLADSELNKYTLTVDRNGVRFLSSPQKVWENNLGASPALAAADVNTDGADELIVAGHTLYVLPLADASWPAKIRDGKAGDNVVGTKRLAIGDIDQDGLKEIIMVRSSTTYGQDAYIYRTAASQTMLRLTKFPTTGYAPLVADLDGDSMAATFDATLGCTTYTNDLVLMGAFYTPPVYYNNAKTQALQYYQQRFAKSNSTGDGTKTGWHLNVGGMLGYGTKVEVKIPLFDIELYEFEIEFRYEMMAKWGRGHEWSSSLDIGDGYTAQETTAPLPDGGSVIVPSRGNVVYSSTSFTCYNFTVRDPQPPNPEYTMKSCSAPSTNEVHVTSIETWYDSTHDYGINQASEMGWMPLDVNGQPSTEIPSLNDIEDARYAVRSSPPVPDDQILVKAPAPKEVGWGTAQKEWWFAFQNSDAKMHGGSIDHNFILETEHEIGDSSKFKTGLTLGAGHEWEHRTTWTDSVSYSGIYADFATASCTGKTTPCIPYSFVPYVYYATGTTRGGSSYRYLVQDYYVTRGPVHNRDADAAGNGGVLSAPPAADPTAPLAAPQAPVVTSSTHPDELAWYPNQNPSFTWSQPAGDSTTVVGYRFFYSKDPEDSPQSIWKVAANQHTYTGLPDGLYYFHIQAEGADGSLSPATHRAFRVDVNAPGLAIGLNPSAPTGPVGWYNQPVTVTLSASDAASGLASLEFSEDGVTWQPYTAPRVYSAETAIIPFQARATDLAGNQAGPISNPIQIDQVPPTIRGSNGQRLHYGNVEILPNGNAQLVLGGVLTDTFSGRSTVLLWGDDGVEQPAGEIGEFPVSALPAPNQVTPTMSTLNWIYRPSFDVRGVYPLYARGIDMAGNASAPRSDAYAYLIGTFWWEPDSMPNFRESQASITPATAHPGDTVEFTAVARNTGFQESRVVVTDTLPAGVTPLPESITEGGTYDPATRQVVWHVRVLWPGETRFLRFNATLDPGLAPAVLQNRLDLEGYWDWALPPEVKPEPAHHYYTTTTPLTVLAASTPAGAPRLYDTSLYEGSLVSDPNVTLLINASPDATSFYVKEWVWNNAAGQWELAQARDWTAFENADNLAVTKDSQGQYARYNWQLDYQAGAHYLGVWVADRYGRISNLNEGNLIYTNLVWGATQTLPAGEKVQYRLPMQKGELAVFNLIITSGEAELYAWAPRHGFHPDYTGQATDLGSGIQLKTIAFYAPESGVYLLELHAAQETTYHLATVTSSRSAGLSADALAYLHVPADTPEEAARQLLENAGQALDERAQNPASSPTASIALPANPITFSTPLQLDGVFGLPQAPAMPVHLYLPCVAR